MPIGRRNAILAKQAAAPVEEVKPVAKKTAKKKTTKKKKKAPKKDQ